MAPNAAVASVVVCNTVGCIEDTTRKVGRLADGRFVVPVLRLAADGMHIVVAAGRMHDVEIDYLVEVHYQIAVGWCRTGPVSAGAAAVEGPAAGAVV